MDFGDILKQWDNMAGSSRPSAAAAGGEKINPVSEWLIKNPVYDKDADLETREREERGLRRRRLLRKRPDAELDLHGKTRDEAWAALEAFFEEARRQDYEKVLLVHGKATHTAGDPVLDRVCRQFIEQCPFAGESGFADHTLGGRGATWVLLKEAA